MMNMSLRPPVIRKLCRERSVSGMSKILHGIRKSETHLTKNNLNILCIKYSTMTVNSWYLNGRSMVFLTISQIEFRLYIIHQALGSAGVPAVLEPG